MLHNRRRNREKTIGGGVGVMLKVTLESKKVSSKQFSSFEHTIVKIKIKNKTSLTLISIYRLLFVPTNIFLKELSELLEILSASNEKCVLSGDINVHLDTDETYAVLLKDIFQMFNLKQYINFPTHKLGHTIDVILARSDSPFIDGILPNDVKLSDHFLLEFKVSISALKKGVYIFELSGHKVCG